MDAAEQQHDVEAGVGDDKQMFNKKTLAFMETAALLTLWSLLVINEGAIRFTQSNPSVGITRRDPNNAPVVLFFIGGLLEVAFGLIGFFVGAAAFVLRWYNTSVTKVSMALQSAMGWFVFIVFVFVQPAFRASSDAPMPPNPGFTQGEFRFFVTLGILTSFHFCLALQGGQFLLFGRLVSAATGRDFLKQQSGNKMRAMFWNGNMAFAGLWTIITGAMVQSKLPNGQFFVSPPNVGTLPEFTIATGVAMLLWGVAGMGVAASGMSVPSLYYMLSGAVYLMAFLNFSIAQLAQQDLTIAAPLDGATALHAGLAFMVTTIGPYFVRQAEKERTGET
ncbi:hypothetical protein BWQ96_06064 [Gracilariopsis chorda]|uniref:Uncharacterized protein n=1 Tax=Gracilariopsis chorda TaxID=448386 RepID=A0A2V3IQ71_9FLOR|nr:hypothetical protein BWQ96_06064 [Gracilariopsis chorda]|eukprot:PXF44204.1 hypothetical protein BWQ96_06064 [Gracilariopsis chorda]